MIPNLVYQIVFLKVLTFALVNEHYSHEDLEVYKLNNVVRFKNLSIQCNSTLVGYKCTSTDGVYDEGFCGIYTKICPDNLGCIDLSNGFYCRSHDFSNFGRQHKLWITALTTREKRSVQSKFHCTVYSCPTGMVCENGICRCLKHFTGKYCDKEIDYCIKNPCKNNARCIPRVGGFTCDCQLYLAGKYCQRYKRRAMSNMKHPNFIFQSFQYVRSVHYYIFHALHLGVRPEVEVDFGDGTVLKKKYSSIHITNAFETFMKYFQLPQNIKSNQLYGYVFKHVYLVPKLYIVRVKAWNGYLEVYDTYYEIDVSVAPKCRLEITLRNAVLNQTVPLQLYRKSAVNIMSATWSNCMQMKLKYDWKLYKLNSPDDNVTSNNIYVSKKKIELQTPDLEIPSFTLDYGRYAIVLVVKMVKPQIRVKQQAITWLNIKQKPIIAHIEGGKRIWVHTKSMFYLDATMSYDPNYAKSDQPPLRFTWTCRPKNTFCKGYYVLNETGPVLIVPANVLEEQKYTFSVWVNNAKDTKITNYTGTRDQEVQGIANIVSFYTIRCLHNCVGGLANSMQIIALRGICISDPRTNAEYKKNWVVYPNPETNIDKGMRLDNSEFSKDNRYIVLYQQQLEAGQQFKFMFSGYDPETSNDIRKRNASFAEFYITTYDIPEVGRCLVDPLEGYGMLTTFSISCQEFLPGGETQNESLLYEVTQFSNLQDRAASGAFMGYTYTGNISNITLSPGLRHNDYVTTLRITAINHNGLSTFFECNVTVFPLIYYFKQPSEVMERLIYMGIGSTSPLNLLLLGGNYFELVQQIISTSFTLEHFLKSQDCRYMDPEFMYTSLEAIQANFMNYLSRVSISGLKSLKHVATALDKVINLPSKSTIWKPSIVLGVDILKKLVTKLEEIIGLYNENTAQDDLDDIGVILVNIAANILKIPTTDCNVVREDINDPILILGRSSYIDKINPYNIASEILAEHDSNLALNLISRYVQLYMTYKTPNERTTLVTTTELSVLMKKAAPEIFTSKSLSLSGRVTAKLLFDKMLYNKNAFCNMEMIVMDNNPNWYENKNPTGFNFPFVKINLTNEVDGSQVDADLEILMRPIHSKPVNIYNGSLPVLLFWKLTEKHIQVHRIIMPKGGKLLIEFFPLKNNNKLRVVVKKNARPKMSDFSYNGINIPQNVPRTTKDKGLSVFIDDEAQHEHSLYYLGVILHMDTLKRLMRHVEEPVLPQSEYNFLDAFHYEDENDSEQYYEETNYLNSMPKIQQIKHTNNNSDDVDQLLPYSFMAHSVRCITWNEQEKYWKPGCNVKASTTSSRVVCNCSGHNPLTVTFQKVSVQDQPYSLMHFSIFYEDNPLIIFIMAFTFILFIGLFHWAVVEDNKDELKRTVCFLVDNYPECEYCYLVIVYTGRIMKAGTTSNVTIELEGTAATSLPHVLKDWTHEVLNRGYQDWFVLKTVKPLGEIYCLHIWTDYSGTRPSWYCSKIIVHDIQEQQVWFFNIEKWFDPIHGDGCMSYTIYQSTDVITFSTADHIKESITREFDSGTHGWFSIFYKHPYSNFTRKQRVAVAYLHMIIMMVILICLNQVPVADSPQHQIYKTASYEWELNDLIMALYTVIIAFPIHNLFVWFFRCIKPSTQVAESTLEQNLARFNISREESDSTWISTERKLGSNKIQAKKRTMTAKKSVAFVSDFFEPEGQRKLHSRASLEDLMTGAGKEKVVPLRPPISNIETDVSHEHDESVPPTKLNPPVYGREIVVQSYCFPPFCVYVAWILLLCAEIPCIYITVLYGISYGWIFSLHYLTSLFLGIFISMFIFEPLKLLCWSFYLFVYYKREYSVEDRSDIVEALNPEFQVPPSLQDYVIQKINKLRKSDMYTPLDALQIRKFKRNRLITFITRMIIADLMLLILLVLLLSMIIFNTYDSLDYRNFRNVKELTTNSKITRRNTAENVQTYKDLVYYLNDTLITNLQYVDDGKRKTASDFAYEDVNYLIGTIRLRQVRKSPRACRLKAQRWAARCIMLFDTRNYSEGWSRRKPNLTRPSPNITSQPWLYTERLRRFKNFFLFYNATRYPPGTYIAFLGKTKAEAVLDLDYLAKNNWFNYLTTAVFIDFVLYNPHLRALSIITVMAERTEQGVYYIYDNISIVKMDSTDSSARLLVLIFLIALFMWLVLFVNKESRKYSLVMPKQGFSKKMSRIKKAIVILGVINIAIYINKTVQMDYYQQKIAQADTLQFFDFQNVEFWNHCLKIFIAFMLFLVILDLCHIFNTFYRVKLFLTVFNKSQEGIYSFLVLLVTLILAFTWAGYILFGRGSYNFHKFTYGFYTVFAFTCRNFKVDQFGNIEQMKYIAFLYYFILFILVFCIFRWLISTIIIHSLTAVKSHARADIHKSVLSDYTRTYFDTIDCNPNRKPIKRILYLQKIEPRIRAVGYLFIDQCNRLNGETNVEKIAKPRRLAMDALALDILRKRHKSLEVYNVEPEENWRKEQAKALIRSLIFRNILGHKLDYLRAKLNILIREERYRKILSRYNRGK